MAYRSVSTYQPVHTYIYTNSRDEDLDMPPHSQGHSYVSQRPSEGLSGLHRSQSTINHSCFQDMDDTLPFWHPTHDVTYTAYSSPSEDLQQTYYSSPLTLYNSSSASSDRLSPSLESRASSSQPSDLYSVELRVLGYGFSSIGDEVHTNQSCVAMQNVQLQADAVHEEAIDAFVAYELPEPQEVVPAAPEDYEFMSLAHHEHPIPVAYTSNGGPRSESDFESEPESEPAPEPEPEPESEYEPNPPQSIRRRRTTKQRPHTAPKTPNQVVKRLQSKHPTPTPPKESPPFPSYQNSFKAFLCPLAPYGCAAAFNAKNEWKRHAATQHFRLGFWRCDKCTQSSSRPNDFNRKDLFVQHVRRMHPTKLILSPTPSSNNSSSSSSKKKSRAHSKVATVEAAAAALNGMAERCYKRTHPTPESCCCVFCKERFEGDGALERRMEHVGKHMEGRRKADLGPVDLQDWREDAELEKWLLYHGTIVKRKGAMEVAK